jgi:hypothetical protein
MITGSGRVRGAAGSMITGSARVRRAVGAGAVLVISAVLSFTPVSLAEALIRVPGECPNVGAALLATGAGDTILVAPGTYYVNLEWPATEGIKLVSELGPLSTILDGRDNVQVIGVYTGVDTTTVITGFTLRNGHAEGQ